MSNDKQQTIVDWLIEIDKYRNITIEEWQQAKEMEKQQKEKSYQEGFKEGYKSGM
jgi:flagellar biosynthesis/type III secretory pathway protein FliH